VAEEQQTVTPPDERELGFDQVLDRLHKIVTRIEQGNLPLEQALSLFEDGVRLSRRGSAILDATEQRIELLAMGPFTLVRPLCGCCGKSVNECIEHAASITVLAKVQVHDYGRSERQSRRWALMRQRSCTMQRLESSTDASYILAQSMNLLVSTQLPKIVGIRSR